MVPNPAKNPPASRSRKPGVHCIRPKPPVTVNCWRHRRRRLGSPTVITNEMIDTINTDVHAAEATLDAALAEHQALPARLPHWPAPATSSPTATPCTSAESPADRFR
jgi:hypothetical protein